VVTANSIIKAVGAVLHKSYSDGEVRYWLSDSKRRAYVSVPATKVRQVTESGLVQPCEPGLLADDPQSHVIAP
jgi:hypothetical protein